MSKEVQWDSTIGEVFPELAETMDAGLRSVTLEQLLSHTSGIRDEPTYINLLLQSYFQPGILTSCGIGFSSRGARSRCNHRRAPSTPIQTPAT